MAVQTFLILMAVWGLVCFAGGLLVGRKHVKELEAAIREIRKLQGK